MEKSVRAFLKYRLPVILWSLFMLIVSSLPRVSQPFTGFPHIDKVAHFIEYGIFAFLIGRALYYSNASRSIVRAMMLSLVFGALFGAIDEIHQLFIPGRTNSIADFAADVGGIISGLLLFYAGIHRHKNRSPEESFRNSQRGITVAGMPEK